ncbi:MAG: glycosyltransferase [Candidatus Brennerbacteria bacterium]|nr:glycosyltransferase [Candidatus Brennerbacteria bacterium]
MRVAIAHDYLNQYGGAERVLEAIMEIFPKAPVYTLLYDEARTLGRFQKYDVRPSFLNRFEAARNHHRRFIPIFPLAQELMNIGNNFDLLISSSAGFAKGIRCGQTRHISYCHTPLRYAWEPDYLDGYSGFGNPLMKILAKPALQALRWWDFRASRKVDVFLANSEFIAKRIKNYYNREADVLYPPVDTKKFYYKVKGQKSKVKGYYLMAGRFLHYKRFDLGIAAFNHLKLPLKIIGAGPEFFNLQKMVKSPFIEFISFVDSATRLRDLYSNASALIFPQIEDFGLVAAEAQACGLPVIAYRGGGAKEIIQEGKTGIFFDRQTPEAIIESVLKFSKIRFRRASISKTAQRFSKENFKAKFKEILKNQFGEF